MCVVSAPLIQINSLNKKLVYDLVNRIYIRPQTLFGSRIKVLREL